MSGNCATRHKTMQTVIQKLYNMSGNFATFPETVQQEFEPFATNS
jgi:hypothetical protein